MSSSHTQIRNTTYPVQRAVQLVQAVSRDVANRLFEVLRTVNLMKLGYTTSNHVYILYMSICMSIYVYICINIYVHTRDKYISIFGDMCFCLPRAVPAYLD